MMVLMLETSICIAFYDIRDGIAHSESQVTLLTASSYKCPMHNVPLSTHGIHVQCLFL